MSEEPHVRRGRSRPSRDELEELRIAVAGLRHEIETRFGKGGRRATPRRPSRPDSSVPARVPQGTASEAAGRRGSLSETELYAALRRLLSSFWMEERSVEVDEFGLDPAYLRNARVLLDFLFERWWRVHVCGAAELPAEGRVLFVANRSGILPYDGLMIAHAIERAAPALPRPRFLVADWLMALPFVQPRLARLGGVRACPENAERLLHQGHPVIAFPEGQKGALKPFRDRYQLQRFARGGFVSLALRLDACVLPVAVVGAEETYPVLFRPSLPARILGVPIPITPTFPLMGPLGLIPLPSQWRIRFGEPIRWDAAARARADDALFVNRTRDRIRSTIQTLLEEEVHRRSGVFRA
ncbi:MAG: lysophospholipid acyltransferase family protein [Myxococcota bacterium]